MFLWVLQNPWAAKAGIWSHGVMQYLRYRVNEPVPLVIYCFRKKQDRWQCKNLASGIIKNYILRKLIVLFVVLSVSTQLYAQQAMAKEQQEVQQAVISFFEALSDRDSMRLKKFCTADIALIEYGSTWNIDTLILKAITLNTAIDFKRTNKLDFIDTKINGNTAWANYHLYSDIKRNGRQSVLHWIETIVAIKENGAWKVSLLHSTLLDRS